ncbi:MAG: EamA family transporter [Acidimicrobiia bacterium]
MYSLACVLDHPEPIYGATAMELGALALGLLAAFALGIADFSGGAAARSSEPGAVAAWTWGTVGVAGLVIAPLGVEPFRPAVIWWGLLGGVLAAVGTTALFYGLANGRIAVVAPLSAVTGASVPVLIDAMGGSSFSTVVLGGIVLALVGVVLTTWSKGDAGGSTALSVTTGLVAGVALALLFVVTAATLDDGMWVIGPVGLSTFGALTIASLWTRRPMRLRNRALGWTAVSAIGTTIAYTSFLLSAAASSFGLAAVVTALYPAITVLAAVIIWHERPAMVQRFGLAIIVAAIALLGGG